MTHTLTSAELATRIKKERQAQGISKAEVARWIGVSRQMMGHLEDPEYAGRMAEERRAEVLRRLLDGAEVRIVAVEIREPEETPLFDQRKEAA